jgi:putative exporter of polyketide antibiotics
MNLMKVMKESLLWWWIPMRAPKTLLTNPSMVSGLRDDQRRRSIIATIQRHAPSAAVPDLGKVSGGPPMIGRARIS